MYCPGCSGSTGGGGRGSAGAVQGQGQGRVRAGAGRVDAGQDLSSGGHLACSWRLLYNNSLPAQHPAASTHLEHLLAQAVCHRGQLLL